MLGVGRGELAHAGPFVGGMTLGVLLGFLAGSALTLLIGEAALNMAKEVVDRLSGRRNRVNFELLLQ